VARMVDVGDKEAVKRVAVAEGTLSVKSSTAKAVRECRVRKGDVITISKLAGIQAAKATAQIVPLCHQIPLTSIEIEMKVRERSLVARATVSATYRTGVEMEALVGVAAALLNAWDMVKYLEKDSAGQYPDTAITEVRVLKKQKGGAARGRG